MKWYCVSVPFPQCQGLVVDIKPHFLLLIKFHFRFSFLAKSPVVLENFLITFFKFSAIHGRLLQKVIIKIIKKIKNIFYFPNSIEQYKVVNTDLNDLLHICFSKLKYHLPFMKTTQIVIIQYNKVKKLSETNFQPNSLWD